MFLLCLHAHLLRTPSFVMYNQKYIEKVKEKIMHMDQLGNEGFIIQESTR